MVEVEVAVHDDVDRVEGDTDVATRRREGAAVRLVVDLGLRVHGTDAGVVDDGELRVGDDVGVDRLDPGPAGAGLGRRADEEAEVETVNLFEAGNPGHERSSQRSLSMTGAKPSRSRTT